MSGVSFGLTLPQRGVFFGVTTLDRLIAQGAEADRSGVFDSVWVGDSLMAKPRPESLTLLGALAGCTERVALGVGCMASFPIRDPIVFAYQWATLDALCGGRTRLAACTGLVAGGVSAAEGAVWGVPDRERALRLEENIEICRQLWSRDDVSFAGRFRSFENVTIDPKPAQQPCPIWIAANPPPGPFFERAMRRVAEKADGWMTVELFPGMLRAGWDRIRELLAGAGRDADAFPVMAYHNIHVGTDRAQCLSESKRFLDEYYGPVFSPPMVEAWTAAGTPDECAATLRGLVDDGAKQITLRVTGWDQDAQYKRLLDEVLPKVAP